jgi:hypothetical protein
MATPHAAGAAALVVAARPASSTDQLKTALISSVDRRAGLASASVSGGRLNAAAALGVPGQQSGTVTPPPSDPPAAQPAAIPVALPAPLAAAPLMSGLRVRVRARRHKAVLSFQLAADARVVLRLERRRCDSGLCRWRLVGTRRRSVPAGAARWTIGPRQGLRLARGTWRVKLTTRAGSVRRRFVVR